MIRLLSISACYIYTSSKVDGNIKEGVPLQPASTDLLRPASTDDRDARKTYSRYWATRSAIQPTLEKDFFPLIGFQGPLNRADIAWLLSWGTDSRSEMKDRRGAHAHSHRLHLDAADS